VNYEDCNYDPTITAELSDEDYGNIIDKIQHLLDKYPEMPFKYRSKMLRILCISYSELNNYPMVVHYSKLSICSDVWSEIKDVESALSMAICEYYYSICIYYVDPNEGRKAKESALAKLTHIENQFELPPCQNDLYYYLGHMYLENDVRKSIEHLQIFIQKCSPQSINYLPSKWLLAEALMVNGEIASAEGILKKALSESQVTGKYSPQAYYELGLFYYHINRPEESECMLDIACDKMGTIQGLTFGDVGFVECRILLGCVKLLLGKKEDAKRLLVNGINDAKHNGIFIAWGHFNLGHIYYEESDFENALAHYKWVIDAEYALEEYKNRAMEYIGYINPFQ